MEIDNLAARAAKSAEKGLWKPLWLQKTSFEMLEDQLSDQVGCWRSLPDDQNVGEPTDNGSACGRRGTGVSLHFGHRGGCASSRLDHSVDLPASRAKFSRFKDLLLAHASQN